MTTLQQTNIRLTYRQVLDAVRSLSLAEQQQLRDELARITGVRIVRPSGDAASVQRGRQMANQIRAELAASITSTLEETMTRLRGMAWS